MFYFVTCDSGDDKYNEVANFIVEADGKAEVLQILKVKEKHRNPTTTKLTDSEVAFAWYYDGSKDTTPDNINAEVVHLNYTILSGFTDIEDAKKYLRLNPDHHVGDHILKH